jgi:hypothetical protein
MVAKLGYPIAEDFVLDAVNLSDGRDFLKEETKTDLIVLCRVFQPHNVEEYYGPCGISIDINQMESEELPPSHHTSLHYSTFAYRKIGNKELKILVVKL